VAFPKLPMEVARVQTLGGICDLQVSSIWDWLWIDNILHQKKKNLTYFTLHYIFFQCITEVQILSLILILP
jgi:hypothetical protein